MSSLVFTSGHAVIPFLDYGIVSKYYINLENRIVLAFFLHRLDF